MQTGGVRKDFLTPPGAEAGNLHHVHEHLPVELSMQVIRVSCGGERKLPMKRCEHNCATCPRLRHRTARGDPDSFHHLHIQGPHFHFFFFVVHLRAILPLLELASVLVARLRA